MDSKLDKAIEYPIVYKLLVFFKQKDLNISLAWLFMHSNLLFTQQKFDAQEKEVLMLKNLKYVIKNFDELSRGEIKETLLHLYDMIDRYS